MVFPDGEVENIDARTSEGGSRGSKLSFIFIIDLDSLAKHGHTFSAGGPSKDRRCEKFIITGEGGQVVAVGVAVALREHVLGVGSI